jgi:serine/threonine protein kinase
MVDIKDGKYRACLADFGLSNMLGGLLRDHVVEGLAVRPGAARWTAPELFMPHGSPCDIKPTMQNDMYSFGRVMFHVSISSPQHLISNTIAHVQVLTLVIPWHGVDEYKVVKKIQSGEDISRPQISEATSDVTDARWNYIEHCWSIDPSGRPCAFKTMKFIKGELEALEQDVSS